MGGGASGWETEAKWGEGQMNVRMEEKKQKAERQKGV